MTAFLKTLPFIDDDDREFLAFMFARFPWVERGFERYAEVKNPQMRALLAAFALKQQPRNGYRRVGVPENDIQSVGSHVGAMLGLAFLMASADSPKTGPIIGAHDLAEAVIGDFTPFDKITDAEKHRLEHLAIRLLFENHPLGDYYVAQWMEFEQAQTPPAQLAKDIDRLEMIMQVQVYEARYPHLQEKFTEFWSYVEQRLLTDAGRRFFKELRSRGVGNPHPLKLLMNRPYRRPWDNPAPAAI